MTKKQITHRYDSLSEMLADIDERHPKTAYASRTHNCRDRFYGGKTIGEVREMIAAGWSEGAVRVAEVRASLQEQVAQVIAAKAAQVHYDVQGDWADVGRIASGEPECCGSFNFQGEDGGARIIKIVANLCVSGAVDHETMFCRGAAVAAATDILEALGYRVEISVGMGIDNYPRNETHDHQFVLKQASQPVDSDRLAAVLCHPSFFRRVGFKWMESFNADPNACYPGPIPPQDGVVTLPELRTGTTPSHEQTVQQVLDICRLCGIVLDGSHV